VVEIPAIKWEEYETGEEEGSQKYIGSVAPIKGEEFRIEHTKSYWNLG
jgi:hypothetical protein